MISVSWTCDDGREGTVDLAEKTRWSIGRGGSGDEQPTVIVDHPMVSRIAMVVRETSAGPVVFRGQRENGARVTIAGPDGSEQWLDEGTAGYLVPGTSRVELVVRDVVIAALEVEVTPRSTAGEPAELRSA